jgi:hypothetical protein
MSWVALLCFNTLSKYSLVNKFVGPAHLSHVSKITAVKIKIARGNLDVSSILDGDVLTGEAQSITIVRFVSIWLTVGSG